MELEWEIHPLLESLWKSTPAQKNLFVDLTDLTGIDEAVRYLLRLMRVSSVTLEGGGIGIRALLGYDQSDGGRLKPAPQNGVQARP